MATIQDIAKHAGVSAATVSRVINNSGYVSTETRQVVEQAIAELNYVPNTHAQNLRRGSTRNLGIITSTLEDPVLARIEPFMQFANEANYTTTLFNTYNDPNRELETLDRL
ncbi:MAG TPA: LacI family DNA-binding transcriptional regulator, partial [Atopostipes sp.]|nr:LacI family DNA-binding transcriptional regulator [Atopostipes sp.]